MYEHLDISNHCKKMADAIDNEVIIRIRDFESVKQAKKYAEYQLRFYTRMMEEKIANQRSNQAASRNSRLIQF